MNKKILKMKVLVAATLGLMLGFVTPFVFTNPIGASGTVAYESTLNIANVTAGDTIYKPSVDAKVDDVLKLEVYYHNKEAENSGLLAKNVNVKVNIPSSNVKNHQFSSTVSGSNIATFTRTATANTQINTNVEYIPGSAYRRYNKGTNENQNWVTEKITDNVTTSGFNISEMKPCYNFQETITVLVRVKTPAISITKQVKVEGDKDWKTEISVKPGETIAYLITFKNEGNVMLNEVTLRDSFPPNLEYVKGSAKLIDPLYPNGKTISDNIINGGVVVGNYGPGSGGYIRFNAKVPSNITECHKYTNVGVVKSKELGEFYNTAIVNSCGTKPSPTPTPTPSVTPNPSPTPSVSPTPIPIKTETIEVEQEQPTTLPVSGPSEAAAGTIGGISLLWAGTYYKKAREAFKKAQRNK